MFDINSTHIGLSLHSPPQPSNCRSVRRALVEISLLGLLAATALGLLPDMPVPFYEIAHTNMSKKEKDSSRDVIKPEKTTASLDTSNWPLLLKVPPRPAPTVPVASITM